MTDLPWEVDHLFMRATNGSCRVCSMTRDHACHWYGDVIDYLAEREKDALRILKSPLTS